MSIEILRRPVDDKAVAWVMRRAAEIAAENAEGTFRKARHVLRERPGLYMRYLEAFAEHSERVANDLDGQTRRAARHVAERIGPQAPQFFRELYATLERHEPEDAFLHLYAAVAEYAGIIVR